MPTDDLGTLLRAAQLEVKARSRQDPAALPVPPEGPEWFDYLAALARHNFAVPPQTADYPKWLIHSAATRITSIDELDDSIGRRPPDPGGWLAAGGFPQLDRQTLLNLFADFEVFLFQGSAKFDRLSPADIRILRSYLRFAVQEVDRPASRLSTTTPGYFAFQLAQVTGEFMGPIDESVGSWMDGMEGASPPAEYIPPLIAGITAASQVLGNVLQGGGGMVVSGRLKKLWRSRRRSDDSEPTDDVDQEQ